MTGITLSHDELVALTGFKRPAEQLRTLHARGYWRAWRDRLGRVVLERTHFDAVSRGQDIRSEQQARPQLRPVAWGAARAT